MKKTTITLTEDQVIPWIQEKFGKARLLADAAKITTAGASLILKGGMPTPKTLKKLGVNVLYEVPK